MRECGTCTSCCDGTLEGNIRGHEMKPGVPCFFVQIGKGCTDYDNRPDDPCKQYNCAWKIDKDIPEEFKPEKTGVILDFSNVNNISYFRVWSKEKNSLTAELLTWAIIYAVQRKYNIAWKCNERPHWIGSDEFCNAMEAKYA